MMSVNNGVPVGKACVVSEIQEYTAGPIPLAAEQETGETVVECASREPSVLPGSFASPSAIAHIATQKYVMYSPLYRLEQEFERMGMKLTRQTMSNWLLHATENWLNPIYDVLRQQLHQHQVLHGG